jgi:putative CocE/NonD family hydrolase
VKMRFAFLLLVYVFLCGHILFAQNSPALSEQYFVERNVAVPMRDGVVLRADVLRPQQTGKFPVLVYRTPYGKDGAAQQYTTFRHAVERGYAVVIEDVRGRYHSDGEFRPYENEGRDGYDTIEWAAAQTWSNGSVGTFGLSYPGAVQWLAAVESPPHLKAMVPAMTFSTPQNFFYAWGAWDLSWIEWIWNNIAPDVRVKKNLPGPHTEDEALAAWPELGPKMLATLPLLNLPELRQVAPYYYDWLRHPPEDPWWDWAELRNKYQRNHAAVLNLSAWYDDNYGPEGATTNYAGLLNSRSGTGDPRTHLLLGPWVHGVDSTSKTYSGERQFGQTAAINYDDVVLRWMDHYLKNVNNGVEREKPVRYFVMGRNQWRESETWPPPAKKVIFRLGPADRGSHIGRLTTAGDERTIAFSEITSDTAHPLTNEFKSSGAHDYRKLADRSDVLTFDSTPLTDDFEVTGFIQAQISLSCDCRDLDLWVRLMDVAPDGTAFNLMSPGLDVLRASLRNGARGRQLLEPGKIYELALNNLITSNMFLKGHRVRVQIFGSFAPNFSSNLQTGESEATHARARNAHIRIYRGGDHASQIVLPVIE